MFFATYTKFDLMKLKLLFSLIFISALISCNQPATYNSSNSEENIAFQKENDSLKNVLSQYGKKDVEIPKTELAVEKATKSNRRGGKHPITLQWISWDKPGEAALEPLDDNWYSIVGSQKNKYGDELKIDGKIRRLSVKELEFEGVIITKTSANNNGEPCIKNGKQLFYAKGNRKYFRLQNMTNCEENMLLDYVDIYAGTSSL